ncbi:MAG TPA: acylphosphatase [Elusimicrobiota bacterium]|nr:acylphosphatase [Elusimicrobiota bacterium]
MSSVRRRYRIFGRVQGVGFRYFCLETARTLALRGWVRNCPDGSVETEAEGPAADLASFAERLQTAHSWARVERMETVEMSPRNDTTEDFEITG